MRCPWCNRFMVLRNRFCPSCGNDLKGVLRPTMISEENLKKREAEMTRYIERAEEKFKDWGKKE